MGAIVARAWRGMQLVRQAQKALLLRQLQRFESLILKQNLKVRSASVPGTRAAGCSAQRKVSKLTAALKPKENDQDERAPDYGKYLKFAPPRSETLASLKSRIQKDMKLTVKRSHPLTIIQPDRIKQTHSVASNIHFLIFWYPDRTIVHTFMELSYT